MICSCIICKSEIMEPDPSRPIEDKDICEDCQDDLDGMDLEDRLEVLMGTAP